MHDFQAADRGGQLHDYTLTLHPGDLGLPIAIELSGGVLAPFARAIEQAVAIPAIVEKLKGIAADEQDQTSVVDMLLEIAQSGKMDLTKVATEMQTSLADPAKIAVLAKKVLHFTSRDKKPLRDPKFFADAYRGNYGELAVALWSVIAVNGFLPPLAGLQTSPPEQSE